MVKSSQLQLTGSSFQGAPLSGRMSLAQPRFQSFDPAVDGGTLFSVELFRSARTGGHGEPDQQQ